MKEPKRARIRYEKGNGTRAESPEDYEGFVLEIWDSERARWDMVCKTMCTKSAEYTSESSNDFVHWSILRQVAHLSECGYIVSM